MNDDFFSKDEKKITFKIWNYRRHSWIGYIIRHNVFLVNILEGAIYRKQAVGKPWLQYLKQVARNTEADS
jgi:hypothetical protein